MESLPPTQAMYSSASPSDPPSSGHMFYPVTHLPSPLLQLKPIITQLYYGTDRYLLYT